MGSLVAGLLAGTVGMAYIVYGRRQARFAPAIAGLALCVYPYFVDGMLWLVLIGVALAIVPFLTDF